MLSPLRDRRRRETAREIHLATLRLALVHGLDAVTSEMIAKEAQISARTFFNYFPNKEAAVMGTPATLPATAPLAEVLPLLLKAYPHEAAREREAILAHRVLVTQSPAVRALHEAMMRRKRNDIADILCRRHPDWPDMDLSFIAEVVVFAGHAALNRWSTGDQPVLDLSVDEVWAQLRDLMGRLAG